MTGTLKKYLMWFANEHLDFRLQPFWIAELSNEEDVKRLASRSVTLRYGIELWSHSDNPIHFHDTLRRLPSNVLEPYARPEVSFKVKVEVFGSSQTQEEKVQRIESFSYLGLRGPVKLNKPDVAFQYIEFYGLDDKNVPDQPYDYYFGRIVTEGQRDLISKLSLKKRIFIGNTSMDSQLSLIMANQGLVKNGSFVFDPFVGSGSLLVAAAQFGGYVLGADIDYLMLHGRSAPTRKQARHKPRHEESVMANMKQYGLSSQYVDLVIADFSLPLWSKTLKLDAIITDPPYGVREAMERLGTTKENKKISEKHLATHMPSKVQYTMTQLLHDLLVFAARHLRIDGRLVTWVPVIRSEYEETNLPKHECLRLLDNSEQILSTNASRRLLTYEKLKEPMVGY
ncbi:unnamed protein product [Nesidiocoris tenuis]|uniref:tRNA (guanine(10)-N(2))-methyltransferase TRMT11 n=1 Tax=Nesidiocoris tenuis TaxID=355587 RepID=A0A6H5HPZ1_9HEMI|nr:unnamed protein product [Nesidiocoris tenuis]